MVSQPERIRAFGDVLKDAVLDTRTRLIGSSMKVLILGANGQLAARAGGRE